MKIYIVDHKDNLFSANHRTAMLSRHNGTAAQWITVDDLMFEATMEAEYVKEPADQR